MIIIFLGVTLGEYFKHCHQMLLIDMQLFINK